MKGESVWRAVLTRPRAVAQGVHRTHPGVQVSLHILQYALQIEQALTPDENVQN